VQSSEGCKIVNFISRFSESLFVIDGSKALRTAINAVFGSQHPCLYPLLDSLEIAGFQQTTTNPLMSVFAVLADLSTDDSRHRARINRAWLWSKTRCLAKRRTDRSRPRKRHGSPPHGCTQSIHTQLTSSSFLDVLFECVRKEHMPCQE
jgi:hypothetical protein